MSENAIVVESLVKQLRRGRRPRRDRSSRSRDGTVFGLLGPNGAGKTTAVRVLATILQPDGGRAEVLGHDVVEQADAVRRRIGLAGQYAAVDPNLTGRENLRMVGVLSQLPRPEIAPRADELLDALRPRRCGRPPAAHLLGRHAPPPRHRRRARAAARRCCSSTSPPPDSTCTSRNELWDMIRELVADGTTVLLTTQYLEEADRLAEPHRRGRRRPA